MNYDRRFSPAGANNEYSTRTMNYRDSRSQPITPRGGIDNRAQYYGKEYSPLRSRSQQNVDQDYGDRFSQPPAFYDNRALDRTIRSKSLDAREFRGDDGFYREQEYPQGGVIIPIRRETGRARPFDVRASPQVRQRELEPYPPFDDRERRGPPGGGEIHIPYNREFEPEPLQNRDFGPARRTNDERGKLGPYREGDSPKSYSSRFQDNRRTLDYQDGRGRGFVDDFERDEPWSTGAVQPYRGPPVVGASGAAGASGYRSSSYQRGHHESHGGHESFGGGAQRGAITQQPQLYHSDGRPIRPIQHHRVQCCCFRFVWPPWSFEQTPPPQPMYRNI